MKRSNNGRTKGFKRKWNLGCSKLTRKKLIDCKWVFIVKYKADGIVQHYKACLVVKGFSQTYGINYIETFVPVATLNKLQVLLLLRASLD